MDLSRKDSPRTLSTATLVVAVLLMINPCNPCQSPEEERPESSFYRSQNVIQATVSTGDAAAVATVARTLKGTLPTDAQISLTGFGTDDPCFLDSADLSETTEYILFLGEILQEGVYPIVANPMESTNTLRRTIRRFARDGAAPTFGKALKDKTYAPGSRATLSCSASGYPSPKLTVTKDDVPLFKGAVKGIVFKSGKGGIRLKFKKMQKELHEGVYACIADNSVHPPIMTSATLEICTLSCANGELNLKKCDCRCHKGWEGIMCDIHYETDTPCNLDCGEHGQVRSDECACQCDANYIGDTCDTVCDKTCDIHGTLDPVTCSCQCDSGYYGDTCSNSADQLCNGGEYCSNGGTCYQVDDARTRELIFLCRCAPGFIGERCESLECNIDCGIHGRVDDNECRCVCDPEYRGTDCRTLIDDHTKPCSEKYEKHFCMNGGECVELVGISKASCRCPILYYGNRCDRLVPDIDCGCLNGGDCEFNDTKKEYECICPSKYTGERCEFKSLPPRPKANPTLHHRARRVKRYMLSDAQENSRKMVITMCVIFVIMLIVIGLVVVVYIKNRNAREKERREKLEELFQRNGLRLRSSLQSTGGMAPSSGAGGSYPADEFEMTNFVPGSSQQPNVTTENEHQRGTRKSSNNSQGRGSLPRSRNGSVNSMPARTSQTSLHSNRSQGEVGGRPSAGGSKEGYRSVPTQEERDEQEVPSPSSLDAEGPGDPDTLPLQHHRVSSDLGSDSEDSDGEGDTIDVPNPQIQAIQNHLGGSDHDSGDYTWDEHSSPGLRITSPYPHDTSPLHQPRGRGRLNGTGGGRSPDHVNIHENPLGDSRAKTDAMNNVMSQDKDPCYADRLRDVVEGSPPSAV